jgi:hypothetical protein
MAMDMESIAAIELSEELRCLIFTSFSEDEADQFIPWMFSSCVQVGFSIILL